MWVEVYDDVEGGRGGRVCVAVVDIISWVFGRVGSLVFFFFQAEDGIRDADVTGVQTCALPISSRSAGAGRSGTAATATTCAASGAASRGWPAASPPGWRAAPTSTRRPAGCRAKIGRASCRERVEVSRGTGCWQTRQCEHDVQAV